MIRIDKENYLKLGSSELNSNIIKSWELSEFTSEESVTPEELKTFLKEHLGEDHCAVTAASASDTEHPLNEEACEALLRAFDPRAAVEVEIARAAAKANASKSEKKTEPKTELEPNIVPDPVPSQTKSEKKLTSVPEQGPLTEEEAEALAEEIMREAEELAEEVLGEANQEAEEILNAAKKKAEEMLKKAQSALDIAQQQAEETANAARCEAAAVNDCAQRDAEALVEGAEHEAENMIAAAQSEAEGILLEAERNRQSIYDEAAEKGYSEGVAASRSAILKMREDYENRLKDFFEQARSYNDSRNAEMEQNVLTLSIDVAESVLDITLDRNFEPFFDLVKSAITQLNAKTRFIMRLNKREYDRFMEKDEMTRAVLSEAPMSVICDGSLEPGALLLQADEGTVDAGIKTQLGRVKKVFGLADEDA